MDWKKRPYYMNVSPDAFPLSKMNTDFKSIILIKTIAKSQHFLKVHIGQGLHGALQMLFLVHAVILCRRQHYPHLQGRELRLTQRNYPKVAQLHCPCCKAVLLTIISYLQSGDCKDFEARGDIDFCLKQSSGSSVKSGLEKNKLKC